MHAMRFDRTDAAPGAWLRFDEVDTPTPGPGELLVEVCACGVCRTDLHIVEGDLKPPRSPLILGHQVVARVVETGRGVTGFGVGDRVGLAWLHETCRSCTFCRRGDENLCEAARFTGFDVDGGFAQFTTVGQDYAYRLPDELTDEQAAPLLCAGIIGYRSLRFSRVAPGGRLGLYGFGASAHITLQIAVAKGIDVYVFSRSPAHRAWARELGAVWSGSVDAGPAEKLDGSIVFAPAGEIIPPAMEHLAPGGTCALAGIHLTAIPEMNYQRHLYREKQLRSVTASTRRDGIEFLQAAAAVPVKTTVQTFALKEANQALLALKEGRIDGAAVLRIASE